MAMTCMVNVLQGVPSHMRYMQISRNMLALTRCHIDVRSDVTLSAIKGALQTAWDE